MGKEEVKETKFSSLTVRTKRDYTIIYPPTEDVDAVRRTVAMLKQHPYAMGILKDAGVTLTFEDNGR
jgi:hypothetical protein